MAFRHGKKKAKAESREEPVKVLPPLSCRFGGNLGLCGIHGGLGTGHSRGCDISATPARAAAAENLSPVPAWSGLELELELETHQPDCTPAGAFSKTTAMARAPSSRDGSPSAPRARTTASWRWAGSKGRGHPSPGRSAPPRLDGHVRHIARAAGAAPFARPPDCHCHCWTTTRCWGTGTACRVR